ncbi:MAG TPA: tetratricopeptide repeat protein, partial [Abditibacteriaceae bacterium]|nr:tetratricopeptide repeat protein [Abditibacteriaceae bacterium]
MKRHYIIASLLILATFVVFHQVLYFDFVSWDDGINVYQNPYLNPVTAPNVLHFWTHTYFTVYTPLAFTACAPIALIARLPAPVAPPGTGPYSLDPHVFHSVNLLLHSLNVLLVFAILRLFVRDARAAGAGALLFAVHPVQVEPVAWVTGMQTLLGGFFALLALWQYLRYAGAGDLSAPAESTGEQSARSRGARSQEDHDGESTQSSEVEPGATKRRRAHYALATLFFALALLTKPITVVIPLMAWVLDRWMLGRTLRQSTRALLPWLAMVAACIVATQWAQTAPAKETVTALWERPRLVGDAFAFYLYKFVLPLHLVVDYGRTPRYVLGHSWSYLTALVPVALAGLLWWQRKPRPWLLTAGAVFAVGVLPTSGVTPYYFHEYSTGADRYLYFAMLGPALGLAYFLNRRRGAAPAGMCALWLLSLGFLAAWQTTHWRDTSTLFQHTLEVNPNSWVAHNHLGSVLFRQKRTAEAIEHFQKALRLKPGDVKSYVKLGVGLIQQHKTAEAIALWNRALKTAPDAPDLHYNLASALESQGQIDGAMMHYKEALRLQPDYLKAYINLGAVLVRRHRTAEAIALWEQALRVAPEAAELYYNLGAAYDSRGETASAVEHYQKALDIEPGSIPSRYNLGVDLLRLGRNEAAIAHLSQVVQLQPDSVEAHFNLGV